MTISDVEKLTDISNIENSDFLHIFRKDEWQKNLLSYKNKSISLSTVFSSAAELNALKQKILSISSDFMALSAKFITKNEVNSTYVSKETLENTTPSLLKYDYMESLTANYVTGEKAIRNAAECRKEANKLADEMTDYVGAAMVGINQSGINSEPPKEDSTKTQGQ